MTGNTIAGRRGAVAAAAKVGDKDGKGAAILKAATEDPRGFYANDAPRVLAEKPGASKSAP